MYLECRKFNSSTLTTRRHPRRKGDSDEDDSDDAVTEVIIGA